jgi:hypothetical protein
MGVRQPTNLHQKQEPPKPGRTTDERTRLTDWTSKTTKTTETEGHKPGDTRPTSQERQRTKTKPKVTLPKTKQDR